MSFIVDSVLILALILIYVDNRLLRANLIPLKERVAYWDQQIATVIIDQGNVISDIRTHADEFDELRSMIADSDRGILSVDRKIGTYNVLQQERFNNLSTRLDNHFNMLAGQKDEIRFLYSNEDRIRQLEEVWNRWLLNVDKQITTEDFILVVTQLYGNDRIHEKQDPGVASELECGSLDTRASEGDLSEGTTKDYQHVGD